MRFKVLKCLTVDFPFVYNLAVLSSKAGSGMALPFLFVSYGNHQPQRQPPIAE
jgi:hypothetical protein